MQLKYLILYKMVFINIRNTCVTDWHKAVQGLECVGLAGVAISAVVTLLVFCRENTATLKRANAGILLFSGERV